MLLHLVLAMHTLTTVAIESQEAPAVAKQRSFEIDYISNTFLKDGNPYQVLAGSFHYFRALPETWQRKLRLVRAAGLHTVTTYVEWSLHNPRENIYEFTGIADLELFIKLAAEEDLLVILRPGPYICAERDMGGFPYWLLHKYPEIKLRTSDNDYVLEVTKWYEVLMTKMEKFLYGNGGPIIMVQVENEYGSFAACDSNYSLWLRDETLKYTKDKAALFTNDGYDQLTCGKIPDVLATLDFGAASSEEIESHWQKLRTVQPNGPLMVSEFYPGWLTHWEDRMQRVKTETMLPSLEKLIHDGVSVSLYMFYGGTNFGFTAGANEDNSSYYNADVTSYDYDAPIDEAGDPTAKYFAIRELIGRFFPLPNVTVPKQTPKVKLSHVVLEPRFGLMHPASRPYLASCTKTSERPLTFEALDQNSGFVLYETILPKTDQDPVVLNIGDLRDRAYVYVDHQFIGILSRRNKVDSVLLSRKLGDKLQILVENQGRINFIIANDFKGILGNVSYNSAVLVNWTMTCYPLDNYKRIEEGILKAGQNLYEGVPVEEILKTGPTLFYAEFELPQKMIADTYLNPIGWGKGIVFINGFNLGRYWPLAGPQITLYVPKEILVVGINKIAMIELELVPESGLVRFSDKPNLDGVFDHRSFAFYIIAGIMFVLISIFIWFYRRFGKDGFSFWQTRGGPAYELVSQD